MTPAGGQRKKLHGKFANRLREEIRGVGGALLGKAARRKAGGREAGSEGGRERGVKIYVHVTRRPRNWRGTSS